MKALKIKLRQKTVSFKKEMMFGNFQTYKFPPPSTVVGWLHNVLGLTKTELCKVSIQCNYEAIYNNPQILEKISRNRKDTGEDLLKEPKIKIFSDKYNQVVKKAMHIYELLVGVDLIIHVWFNKEKLNYLALENLKNASTSLGRHEDLINIISVNIVNYKKSEEDVFLNYNMLLPTSYCKQNHRQGIRYNLPYIYKKSNKERIFSKADCMYITRDKNLSDVYVDAEGDPLYFLKCDALL